ncbi:elongation factor P maturation arginine rhamnosyltransferase EarP [Herbaspirillum rhizosphaerae]|uniref:elongation factor P maturation arginine rhamnosyltransferase EarP n=1 Tax=Herbaspirillum rhizosphaerae TaxID=346179 RepID=UPI00067C80BE|nr:elongation factor P maturation arginine rhamnosyltransferase EarP [Herbaspirillum rhizosphaerae]
MHSTTSSQTSHAISLTLFCKVVDNYGDIGICWRLARQLAHEHGVAVTLWVDDLASFRSICPEVDSSADVQDVQGIAVQHWRDQNGVFAAGDVADIVVEFFACDIPPGYIKAMSECAPRPVWLNLEGLTAETWVEGCHTLPSPHPQLPLTKYFFFPGFNRRTGGLQLESGLIAQREAFLADPRAASDFLAQFGVTETEMRALKVSLFCYPQAPIAALFAAWQASGQAVLCLVPEGVGGDAVTDFLGQPSTAGAHATRGALTVRVLPFVPQPDYDKLLWACDVNFVRGEDSFVRAQWAAKPFIWHIYPQDENLHHVKLKAFLSTSPAATPSLTALALAWNGATGDGIDIAALWRNMQADLPNIARLSMDWERVLLANGDLATNLLKFAETVPPRV